MHAIIYIQHTVCWKTWTDLSNIVQGCQRIKIITKFIPTVQEMRKLIILNITFMALWKTISPIYSTHMLEDSFKQSIKYLMLSFQMSAWHIFELQTSLFRNEAVKMTKDTRLSNFNQKTEYAGFYRHKIVTYTCIYNLMNRYYYHKLFFFNYS